MPALVLVQARLLCKFDTMCTLAIYFRTLLDYPVVIAANRDEFLARPSAAPSVIREKPCAVGGKDLRAGGTWLGINERGLIAGLLNRHTGAPADPSLRSRGLLCLEVLGCSSPAEARELVKARRGSDFNPFNLLVASRQESFVAYNHDGAISLVGLSPGLHLLTNLDVDDFECLKISGAYPRFAELGERAAFRRNPVAERSELRRLLADHTTQLDPRSGKPNSICLHLDGYGTRSSSLIFLGAEPSRLEHFFAPGPPCTTDFERVPVPSHSPA
jgi:uncharacterized protein with NRDE domain